MNHERNKQAFFEPLVSPLLAILAFLQDTAGEREGLRACCGVSFEPRRPADDMPTPSSCCGVRV